MLTALFALLYWAAILWAACGAVVLCGLLWFWFSDTFLEPVEDERQCVRMERVIASQSIPPVRPYDHMDPLEQAFLLPDAPDPKWRMA